MFLPGQTLVEPTRSHYAGAAKVERALLELQSGRFGNNLPSGYVKIAIENGPVEIVEFPINSMVDLSIVMVMFLENHHF
jgi:hypothetical protein